MRSAEKINEIFKNISGSNFSVILGTETSWEESIQSEEIFGARFNVYRDDRDPILSNKKSGGGVVAAISCEYDSEQISVSKHKEFEQVWTKVHIGNEIHIFGCIYFPPEHSNKDNFQKFFASIVNVFRGFKPEYKVHLYGDFNQRNIEFVLDEENEFILLPVCGENETLQYLFDKMASFGLNQINHVKNSNNRYLDL